ncbi:hypothetical protein P3T43_005343 [Paraburkholderia sp. GAS41]|jgi:hypothetical protein
MQKGAANANGSAFCFGAANVRRCQLLPDNAAGNKKGIVR